MNTVYSRFTNAHPLFYDTTARATTPPSEPFQVAFDNGRGIWDNRTNAVWSFWQPAGAHLPEQGWKIHVASTSSNAAALLSEVSGYCVQAGLAFKFLRDRHQLEGSLSKDADRASSGKFITVYPPDEDTLLETLRRLEDLIGGQPGPYILSDLRWMEGPLYVRYGAFTFQTVAVDGVDLPALLNPGTGRLEADIRGAAFHVPAWVTVPPFLQEQLDALDATPPAGLPRILRALQHSNAGGVYEAEVEERLVILKEARPNAGWTPDGRDAVERLHDEIRVLGALAHAPTPGVVGSFESHGHHFLAMERIDGEPLNSAVVARHPLARHGATPEARADYRRWALATAQCLRAALEQLHASGRTHGDLHPGNVIVRPDQSVALIDLEMSRTIDEPEAPTIGVPGFVPTDRRTSVERDLYGLACINVFIFAPLTTLLALDAMKARELIGWAATEFDLPAWWVEETSTVLAPGDVVVRPVTPPRILGGASLTSALGSVISALDADADPQRTDRLWPGDPAQFGEPATSLAHGSLGVMAALRLAGVADLERHVSWVHRVSPTTPARLGLMDGAAGAAWAFRQLDEHDAAEAALTTLTAERVSTLGTDLYSGLPGVGLVLLDESEREPRFLDAAVSVAGDLHAWLASAEPPPQVATGAGGLLRGATGTALFALRLYEKTGDPRHLQLSTRALDYDLRSLLRAQDGSLQVNEGWRVLPYLGHGSAGIGVVAAQILRHVDERDEYVEALSGIERAASAPFTIQPGLFQGRAGLVNFLLALREEERASTAATLALEEHLAQFTLHALPSEAGLRFVGDGLLRASCDLATGSAGVLTALSGYAAMDRGAPLAWAGVPFLISPRTDRPHLSSQGLSEGGGEKRGLPLVSSGA